MKILVCISNYGNTQINFLKQILSEYNHMDFEIDVILDTTYRLDLSLFENINIQMNLYRRSIKRKLVFKHRENVVNNKDNYDLFLYTENDLLITKQNIIQYLDITKKLPKNYITGFLRYEEKNNEKYLIDVVSEWYTFRQKNILLNGEKYFTMENLHQGSWILTKDQLEKAIKSKNFFIKPHTTNKEGILYEILESGATDIYTLCSFKHKVFPYEGFEKLLIPHLPNKYINLDGFYKRINLLTLKKLKELL